MAMQVGIVILDYDAAPIRESAFGSATLFMAAGVGVLALTRGTRWLLLRRHAISPLAELDAATRALAC